MLGPNDSRSVWLLLVDVVVFSAARLSMVCALCVTLPPASICVPTSVSVPLALRLISPPAFRVDVRAVLVVSSLSEVVVSRERS